MKDDQMVVPEERGLQDPPDGKQARGKGFPQILHDRARESSQQLHKLLLSFSTGLLAVYFIALTATDDAAKPGVQTIAAITGLVTTGLAVFAGLLGLYADMKRNYFRAAAIQAKEPQRRDKLYKTRDQWRQRQRFSIATLNLCFLLGVTSSVVYVIFRVLDC